RYLGCASGSRSRRARQRALFLSQCFRLGQEAVSRAAQVYVLPRAGYTLRPRDRHFLSRSIKSCHSDFVCCSAPCFLAQALPHRLQVLRLPTITKWRARSFERWSKSRPLRVVSARRPPPKRSRGAFVPKVS